MSLRVKIDRARSLVIIIVITLTLCACGSAPSTFRPLSQSEVEAFSVEQGVTFLNQRTFEDSRLLLYEKGTSFGYYTLSVRAPEGELVMNRLSASKPNDPILVFGQSSGTYPFVAVIIQAPALSAETTTVEVADSSGSSLTMPTHGEVSAVLVSPAFAEGWGAVTLYDAQGEVLYRQES